MFRRALDGEAAWVKVKMSAPGDGAREGVFPIGQFPNLRS
jgi:hypothetical protein